MNQEQFLRESRSKLKALEQNDDVCGVLHIVENNLKVLYGRGRVKAFNGEFVVNEVNRILLGSGTASLSEASASPHRSESAEKENSQPDSFSLVGTEPRRQDEYMQEKIKDLSRHVEPQLRAGEADLRDDHRGGS